MTYERLIPVGKHGFVRYVDHMGDDTSIVQAARVSYGDGTKSVREDKELIAYLIKNGHTSPLEMVELKLHISATIFEARQMVRHRTASWSEISGRYSILQNNTWNPEASEIRKQAGRNKQGSEGTIDDAQLAATIMEHQNSSAYKAYLKLLEMSVGREQARSVLPQSMYTQFYWKIDGNNLLKVLALRDDAHAQAETQVTARAIKAIAVDLFPWMMEAYEEWMVGATKFSRSESIALRSIILRMVAEGYDVEKVIGQSLGTDDAKRIDEFKRKLYG